MMMKSSLEKFFWNFSMCIQKFQRYFSCHREENFYQKCQIHEWKNNLCMEGFQKMKLKIREILNNLLKFIYSKNATNFCKISTIDFVGFLRIYELYLPCFWRICDIITGLPVAYCGFSFSSQMKGGLAKDESVQLWKSVFI